MAANDKDIVIPIIREEVHAEAAPVVTGGVRVTKRVERHDELVEQRLLKSSVDVERVPVDQIVDGPQPVRREGNTTIIPVVSEVLHVEKQFVLTEEIHLTENQQHETVQTKVTLYNEQPEIERLDRNGDVISSPVALDKAAFHQGIPGGLDSSTQTTTDDTMKLSGEPASILKGRRNLSPLPPASSILTNRPRK